MDKAKKIDKGEFKKPRKTGKIILTVVLSLISVVYISPIIIVLFNSFKVKTAISAEPFALPNGDTFVGFENFLRGMV